MKTYTKFKEYIWLVNTIHEAKSITLAEINRKWVLTEMSEGEKMPRTTFYRHKCAIEDIFGIIIDCDKKNGNKYFINNDEVLDEETVQNWMISTLSVGNLVEESQSLHHRILLEHTPSGGEKLRQVLKAMKESRCLMITYRRYSAPAGSSFTIEPYCVKLFSQRWYLLGKLSNGFLATFSFDRIESIDLLDLTFELPEDFDAAFYFKDSYGIVVDNKAKLERIVLRAHGLEKYYLRDLPLHPSQQEINTKEEYADFELRLRPTTEFKAALLSRGQWIEVLEPQTLADEIVEWHQKSIERYQKK
ncbi:MAG: WYL domain-containing protein [Bacteroidaceae bacterium]|nr:WYL domain-containing protein [Bacteroidaceae bacterium]